MREARDKSRRNLRVLSVLERERERTLRRRSISNSAFVSCSLEIQFSLYSEISHASLHVDDPDFIFLTEVVQLRQDMSYTESQHNTPQRP